MAGHQPAHIMERDRLYRETAAKIKELEAYTRLKVSWGGDCKIRDVMRRLLGINGGKDSLYMDLKKLYPARQPWDYLVIDDNQEALHTAPLGAGLICVGAVNLLPGAQLLKPEWSDDITLLPRPEGDIPYEAAGPNARVICLDIDNCLARYNERGFTEINAALLDKLQSVKQSELAAGRDAPVIHFTSAFKASQIMSPETPRRARLEAYLKQHGHRVGVPIYDATPNYGESPASRAAYANQLHTMEEKAALKGGDLHADTKLVSEISEQQTLDENREASAQVVKLTQCAEDGDYIPKVVEQYGFELEWKFLGFTLNEAKLLCAADAEAERPLVQPQSASQDEYRARVALQRMGAECHEIAAALTATTSGVESVPDEAASPALPMGSRGDQEAPRHMAPNRHPRHAVAQRAISVGGFGLPVGEGCAIS